MGDFNFLDRAYGGYRRRRTQHPDNQRMSRLRRAPGEGGVERLNSRDEYGAYYVVDCNLDPDGNWHCKHHYHDYPHAKAWHTIYKSGGHFFQNPDGTQCFYHPHQPSWIRWKRASKNEPKLPWPNPQSECVASVNPPPRWWVEQNRLTPFPGQNELADELDRRFANAPNAPEPSTRRPRGRASRYLQDLRLLLPDDAIVCYDNEPYDPYLPTGYSPYPPTGYSSYAGAQPDKSSEEDGNKPKNASADDCKKEERADGFDDPSERGVIQNCESASAIPTAASLNHDPLSSSQTVCESPQKKGKQAVAPQDKIVETPAPTRTTVPTTVAAIAGARQTKEPKPSFSHNYEDDEDWMYLSRMRPKRKRRAEVDAEPQSKKSRMASKRQDRV